MALLCFWKLLQDFFAISQRAIAAMMALGAGVLISSLASKLMDEAYRKVDLTQQRLVLLVARQSIRLNAENSTN